MSDHIPTKVKVIHTEIPIVEYRSKRVVTFAIVDEVHKRPSGTARKRFHDNRRRFIEEEDFYFVDYSQMSVFRTFGISIPPRGIIVLTESGYLMLVKSFTDDLAWDVQRVLVNSYFKLKSTDIAIAIFQLTMNNLRLSEASKIKMLTNFGKLHGQDMSYLPEYTDENITKSLSELLREYDVTLSARTVNQILIKIDILEEQSRPSTKSGSKKFKSLTKKGLKFGKNLINLHNERETQPHYYSKTFPALLEKINNYLQQENKK